MTAFETLVGRLDYAMLIVTAAAEGRRAGCLVGFATQTSIDPSRFLVCLSDKNFTCRVALAAPALAVHFVPAGADALAELFGGETGDEVDKFERVAWRAGPAGVPILDDCPNWFAGRVVEHRPLGDHIGFLLDPIAAAAGPEHADLGFHRARRIEPGHEA